jgi:general secretion pathway protein E
MTTDQEPVFWEVPPADTPPDELFARVIREAIDLGASDLFVDTDPEQVSLAVRHLGIVRPLMALPSEEGGRLIRYIKAESGMDISERRRPLDGRWIFLYDNRKRIDLRINTVPTLYGEDLTIRLLDREMHLYGLEWLGMMPTQFNDLLAMLASPSGLILVTGPTGAGKTTTLYACIRYLNDGKRRINTIEDPIEYALDGVRQSQINPLLQVDFPDLLRAILRQSPDVIMIGEIRDRLTAETAVRAANSGHVVFATLHARVAAGAVQSLLSLGIHPHFVANSLLGVLSQRLVRTLCPQCKIAIDMSDSPATFAEVQSWLGPTEGRRMCVPGRCDACRQSGYAGRTGIFEVLKPTREMRHLIATQCAESDVETQAIRDGMIEFRRHALLAVAKGKTSIDEVFRVLPTEQLGLNG